LIFKNIQGGNRLAKNIYFMNGEIVNIYFKVCWYGVTPLFIFVIWMLNWIEYEPIKYGTYEFSSGALGFGWCIAVASLVVIPIAAVHSLLKAEGATFKEKFFYTLRPTIGDFEQKVVENRSYGLKSAQVDPIDF
jgi:hypothetical protein